jgi:hypothetical protein
MKTAKKHRRPVGTSFVSSWMRRPSQGRGEARPYQRFLADEARRRRVRELLKNMDVGGALLATPDAVWTFSRPCFNRPKGEQRIAQALRPGKAYGKKIALKGRPTSGRYSQEVTFVKRASMAFRELTNLFWYKNLRAHFGAKATEPSNVLTTYLCVGSQSPVRTPFQGDFVVRVVPRAEALGYSLFALRAMAKYPNSGPRAEALGCSVFALRAMPNVETPCVICNAREPGASSSSPREVAALPKKVSTQMRPDAGDKGLLRNLEAGRDELCLVLDATPLAKAEAKLGPTKFLTQMSPAARPVWDC